MDCETSDYAAYTKDSFAKKKGLSNLSIEEPLAGTTPVSFTFIPCFLNKDQSLSIGFDKEHTDEGFYAPLECVHLSDQANN